MARVRAGSGAARGGLGGREASVPRVTLAGGGLEMSPEGDLGASLVFPLLSLPSFLIPPLPFSVLCSFASGSLAGRGPSGRLQERARAALRRGARPPPSWPRLQQTHARARTPTHLRGPHQTLAAGRGLFSQASCPHRHIVRGTMGSCVSLVGTGFVRRRKQHFLPVLEN